MSDSASPVAFSARNPGVPKGVATAFLWTVGSLTAALAIYALAFLVAAAHQREAELAAQDGTGYAQAVIGVMALRHGFPSQHR